MGEIRLEVQEVWRGSDVARVPTTERRGSHPGWRQMVVTDTVPPFRLDPEVRRSKLVVLDAAALFAEAMRRLHTGGSLVDLLSGIPYAQG
jgi:ribose-phosphate pyrophosphokinase